MKYGGKSARLHAGKTTLRTRKNFFSWNFTEKQRKKADKQLKPSLKPA